MSEKSDQLSRSEVPGASTGMDHELELGQFVSVSDGRPGPGTVIGEVVRVGRVMVDVDVPNLGIVTRYEHEVGALPGETSARRYRHESIEGDNKP